MKWTPITTEISLIFGKFTDRWFVIQKPHKWSLDKSSGAASVSTTLEPFTPQGRVWFPLPMGRDNAGLTIVATDAPMYHTFKSMFKNGRIGSKYRCLADVSNVPGLQPKTNKRGNYDLPPIFMSNHIKQFGSFWKDDGLTLNKSGKLVTNIQSRPFKYSLRNRSSNTNEQPDVIELMQNIGKSVRSSRVQQIKSSTQQFQTEMNNLLHISPSKLRRFMQNESNPSLFNNTLRKNILAMTCKASDSPMAIPASLSYELQSIASSISNEDEFIQTALYEVKLHTIAAHQLRIQFSEAGCPIYGDYLYHPKFNRWLVDDLLSSNTNKQPIINDKLRDPFGYEDDQDDEIKINSVHNDNININKSSVENKISTNELIGHQCNSKEPISPIQNESLKQGNMSNSLIYIQLYQLSFRDPLNPHYGQIFQFELDIPTDWKLVHDNNNFIS